MKPRNGNSKFEDIYIISGLKPIGEGTSGCVYECIKVAVNYEEPSTFVVKVMRNVDDEMSKSIF